MLEIVLSSRNKGKKRELKTLLKGLKVKVLDLNDLPSAPRVKETGRTFEANAKLKALKIARSTGLLTIADDSGLVVKALGGKPGVRSARFAGERSTDRDNYMKLLDMMAGVPRNKRGARFVSAVAIADKAGVIGVVRGECAGRIASAPAGKNGFGYDPVFYSPRFGKTFAQITSSRKNSVSHRGRALKKARTLILNYLRRSLS